MNNKCVELLKQVIKNNYKNVRLDKTIVNNDEFYYEFQSDISVSENDFIKIENEMKKLDDNIYIKLVRISGVYLEGNKENEMIQRIVGKSFKSNEESQNYIKVLEEAKERDHRKIGQDLDLFCFSDYVGAGLPLFTPRGTIIIDELKKEMERICKNYGFEKVSCPSLADISLFETSGHTLFPDIEHIYCQSEHVRKGVLSPISGALGDSHQQPPPLRHSIGIIYRDLPLFPIQRQ